MCFKCLTRHLASIEERGKVIDEDLAGSDCDCGCREYVAFLKHINQKFKIVCLAKIKRKQVVCPQKINAYLHMEITKILEIKTELASAMDKLTAETEDLIDPLCEGDYLEKANQFKSIYDLVEELEEADHR
jgi:hypothetical protein